MAVDSNPAVSQDLHLMMKSKTHACMKCAEQLADTTLIEQTNRQIVGRQDKHREAAVLRAWMCACARARVGARACVRACARSCACVRAGVFARAFESL